MPNPTAIEVLRDIEADRDYWYPIFEEPALTVVLNALKLAAVVEHVGWCAARVADGGDDTFHEYGIRDGGRYQRFTNKTTDEAFAALFPEDAR